MAPADAPRASRAAGHDHARCVDTALDRASALCAARGVRLTALRRRVLELVWRDHTAVKAYDLLRELGREAGVSAKPPTVYRALEFLIEQGFVHRLESLNAYVGCPMPGREHEGQFLICDRCGDVSELDAPAVRAAIAARAADRGFAVSQETIEVHGTCHACRGPRAGLSR